MSFLAPSIIRRAAAALLDLLPTFARPCRITL